MTEKTVLLTGGAGFIGSHTCVELLGHGYDVVVVDDHSNSYPSAVRRIEKLAGPVAGYYELDLRRPEPLRSVFANHSIDAVVHFAAKKSVGESVHLPLEYYDINVGATTTLLRVMAEFDVNDLVFSSSCSIYGKAAPGAISEDRPTAPTNPYARSKLMCEQILGDAVIQNPQLRVAALRYFNPIGAHPSALLGEDPRGVPSNVMPFLAQIAVGRRPALDIFGDDYETSDGTCVRDYVHVLDIADGHRLALEKLDAAGLQALNLGTGVGTSVLELVRAFEAASGLSIPVRMTARRTGDVDELVADPSRVAREWGWRAQYSLQQMCADAWDFQRLNPDGYEK